MRLAADQFAAFLEDARCIPLQQDIEGAPDGRIAGNTARTVRTSAYRSDDQITEIDGATFGAPDLFEKKTLEPAADLMRVDGDRLYMEKDGRKYRLLLSKQPQAAAFVDAIAGLLKGDAGTLERNYDYQLEGKASKWTLTLVPKDKKVRDIVSKIVATGDQQQLKSIEYLQADGDRSVMVVEPLSNQ